MVGITSENTVGVCQSSRVSYICYQETHFGGFFLYFLTVSHTYRSLKPCLSAFTIYSAALKVGKLTLRACRKTMLEPHIPLKLMQKPNF